MLFFVVVVVVVVSTYAVQTFYVYFYVIDNAHFVVVVGVLVAKMRYRCL